MPVPIIGGLIQFTAAQLQTQVWDGEVPRTDTSGNPIAPNTVAVPQNWPVVKLWMSEAGFTRGPTFEDPYGDVGQILFQVWGVGRLQEETMLARIEALYAQASNWPLVQLGGDPGNPNVIYKMLLSNWSSIQTGERTDKSEYLYRGELNYDVEIHGLISSA